MRNKGFKGFLLFGIIFLFFISCFSFCFVSAGSLKVTSEHPFLVNGSWISASDLKVGDMLKTDDGRKVRITSIEDVVSDFPISVYNLEAGVFHNFVASSGDGAGVVVHNSEIPPIVDRFSEVVRTARVVIKEAVEEGKRGVIIDLVGLNNEHIGSLVMHSEGTFWTTRISVSPKYQGGGAANRLFQNLAPFIDNWNIQVIGDSYVGTNVEVFKQALAQILREGIPYDEALKSAIISTPSGKNMIRLGFKLSRIQYNPARSQVVEVIWRRDKLCL